MLRWLPWGASGREVPKASGDLCFFLSMYDVSLVSLVFVEPISAFVWRKSDIWHGCFGQEAAIVP